MSVPYWSTNYLALSPPAFVTFDLSGVYYKSRGDIMDLRNAWNMFEQIEASNIQTSTLIGLGIKHYDSGNSSPEPIFYQFPSFDDRTQYVKGQLLHVQRYPYINFSTIARR
jgi:hypothetical protein